MGVKKMGRYTKEGEKSGEFKRPDSFSKDVFKVNQVWGKEENRGSQP